MCILVSVLARTLRQLSSGDCVDILLLLIYKLTASSCNDASMPKQKSPDAVGGEVMPDQQDPGFRVQGYREATEKLQKICVLSVVSRLRYEAADKLYLSINARVYGGTLHFSSVEYV